MVPKYCLPWVLNLASTEVLPDEEAVVVFVVAVVVVPPVPELGRHCE